MEQPHTLYVHRDELAGIRPRGGLKKHQRPSGLLPSAIAYCTGLRFPRQLSFAEIGKPQIAVISGLVKKNEEKDQL
jgi:hypothetical protein